MSHFDCGRVDIIEVIIDIQDKTYEIEIKLKHIIYENAFEKN